MTNNNGNTISLKQHGTHTAIKRKIKIVEFSSDVLQFIRNMIYPLKTKDIKNEEGIIKITGNDTKTKALLIGRESKNLKNLRNVVKRYFEINDIMVI